MKYTSRFFPMIEHFQIIEKKKLDTGLYKNCSEGREYICAHKKFKHFFLDNFGKDKLLINNLINSIEAGELDESGVLDEIHSILAAGEIAAITNALLLCMMGLHSNIQVGVPNKIKMLLLFMFPHRKISKRNLILFLVTATELSLYKMSTGCIIWNVLSKKR
jgi:hypothetical protein